MPAYRFFLDQHFVLHESYELPSQEAHHIFKVMRCQVGEILEFVNGQGQMACAQLIDAHTIQVNTLLQEPPPPELIVAQALIKPNRLDSILEKGTELGMTQLWLFEAEKSEKSGLSNQQAIRLNHLSIAALKQCGRLDLPKILIVPPLLKWTSLPCTSYYGSLNPQDPWLIDLIQPKQPSLFLVGPEAGLTQAEQSHLNQLGAQAAKLHRYTLRAETAPLVALSLLSQKY
ncbi:MAG: 16S rRNA (uracil(1498)-N(3))-methyltransferase [Verrucomicrobia bacterium]|nr:16S rRNA (uracil(1498)-N(3))-methyltransferase [Verrucomicrobiota bacterium]MBS0646732.1 16S rRNA (uracil(1498)-N(3))-methyltransferase [Verrucomicrobiota bacterium]